MTLMEMQSLLLMVMALFCPSSILITIGIAFIVVRQAGWMKEIETTTLDAVDQSSLPLLNKLIEDGWKVESSTRSEQVGLYTIILSRTKQRIV